MPKLSVRTFLVLMETSQRAVGKVLEGGDWRNNIDGYRAQDVHRKKTKNYRPIELLK